MNQIRKTIAVLLVAVLLYSVLGSSFSSVFAAAPVRITIDKFENGTLSLQWIQPAGAKAAVVSFHKPNTDDTAVLITSEAILTGNTASISGLKADYIYDISVTIYGEVTGGIPTGEPIGKGLIFFLPSITFTSDRPAQESAQLPDGGFEIGGSPKLKLSWKVPKVYYGVDDKFIPANHTEALKYIQDSLNGIYNDNRVISTLNYRINISTDFNSLKSTPNKAALLVEQKTGDNYLANISGNEVNYATVTTPDAGLASLELWGRADESSTVPDTTDPNVLPDAELLPGTVYYMNIKPIFENVAGTSVTVLTVGDPTGLNGSLLSGERSYTSTPIRFQITKDSANNIYIKIYQINQGSLNLPRLFYEVQASDDSGIEGDWVVKKTMDNSYFSGISAVTVITNVNPSNTIYYKIVVKSENSSDRLESLPLPYTLTVDTSKPPLPMGITVVDRTLKSGQAISPKGVDITVKSTDVTISWDKPLNWGNMDNTMKEDLYFHFLLSTNQTESTLNVPLYVNGTYWDDSASEYREISTYWGDYPVKYRLVKYVSAASDSIKEEGNRLTYTMKAFDLFKREDSLEADIDNTEQYPTFLIPNTVYYLQMYTTTEENKGKTEAGKMSDRSIITSFTTLNGVELDVPLPMSFALDANGKDTSTALNYIDLKFDKVSNIDWNNYTNEYNETKYTYETYYDIFMNTRTDTIFTQIGTTKELHGDVGFTGADDPQSTSIKAKISQFTDEKSHAAYTLFGSNLLPNTRYYFKVETRLVIKDRSTSALIMERKSIDTAILPVTTIVLKVSPPDDSLRKPLAPTDFIETVDNNQNQLPSGGSVTFTWKRQEDDVIYEIIRTAQKVSPADGPGSYSSDPEYQSFVQEYNTLSDSTDNDAVYLDPVPPVTGNPVPQVKVTYDSVTKICTFTVDRRMFPNKLYYFSLKAVRVDAARVPLSPASESAWVSIPVTTSLIEAPASLEVVVKAELGFYWKDATAGLTAEDYRIYAKGTSDAEYKLITRSQSTIVKDADGETYYGRITDLKMNSYYDIRVIKGVNTPVYDKSELKTRDGYHELEVKWMGSPTVHYSRYDIAIMAEGGSEYTVLSASDLEQYVDKDGAILPYYTEETALTAGSEAVYYHARIKSAKVVLAGGIITNQPLRSNVKYYIKVRKVTIDPTELDLIAYSKYIGPVNTRTEFNQDDYDNTDREEQQKAVFLDRMEDLEKDYFWKVAAGSSVSAILLKGDRVADAIRNSSGDSFTVDMTAISINASTDEIYVPVTVIKVMNLLNKSLVIRTSGAELLLRPTTLDVSSDEQIKGILWRPGVKDLYVKMDIIRSNTVSTDLPSNYGRVSSINELDIQALGLSLSDNDLKQLFHDKLYNKDSGLVGEKLNMLLNTYVGSGTGASALIDQYTQSLVEMIEKDLSTYINSTLQSVKLSNAIRDVTVFSAPISASLSFSAGKGVKLPYVLYDGTSSWQKITTNTVKANSSVQFNLLKTGKYVILSAQDNIGDVPTGYWAEGYIASLTSKYDLGDVFSGINNSFMPENKATCKEVVLLYEKVTGKSAENSGLDIRQKNVKLGLEGIVGSNDLMKNVKRQETAAVLLKLFSVKKGVSTASLRPGGRVDIADEGSIGDDYFNPVLIIVDLKVMNLDDNSKFNPGSQMTRAEIVAAFVKLLEMTGDL